MDFEKEIIKQKQEMYDKGEKAKYLVIWKHFIHGIEVTFKNKAGYSKTNTINSENFKIETLFGLDVIETDKENKFEVI